MHNPIPKSKYAYLDIHNPAKERFKIQYIVI